MAAQVLFRGARLRFAAKLREQLAPSIAMFKRGEINEAKTQGIIITRRVSEGLTETPVKRESSIPH